jgi:hypothetical protein
VLFPQPDGPVTGDELARLGAQRHAVERDDPPLFEGLAHPLDDELDAAHLTVTV